MSLKSLKQSANIINLELKEYLPNWMVPYQLPIWYVVINFRFAYSTKFYEWNSSVYIIDGYVGSFALHNHKFHKKKRKKKTLNLNFFFIFVWRPTDISVILLMQCTYENGNRGTKRFKTLSRLFPCKYC